MVAACLAWWRRFARATPGNVAMTFGLLLMPVLFATGAGVDMSRAMLVKQRMGEALDAAGLAVGGTTGLSEQEIQVLAQRYFDANFENIWVDSLNPVQVSVVGSKVTMSVSGNVPTTLMRIAGFDTMEIGTSNEVTRNFMNLEIALVLDVTGSMSGQRIVDLKAAAKSLIDTVVWDDQSEWYSKVALVPYAAGVNVGAAAAQVRGAIPAPKAITDATWKDGPPKSISNATRANPVVITANNHGFSQGDRVYITGVNGMWQLNNKQYTVTNATTHTFKLSGVNGWNYNNYSWGGTVQRCATDECEVEITSSLHGFANGEKVYITGVGGMTQINDELYTVANRTANTFVLSGVVGTGFGNYSSGGSAYCTTLGCEYYRFMNASWWNSSERVFRVSTCVSERTGPKAYTDFKPAPHPVGFNYPASNNPCPSSMIVPLSSDKTMLKNQIDAFQVGGSTAGQIGLAWGWFMLSPNFAYLWPAASQPAAYNEPKVMKVAVLMTDGAFNTPYCNGVIAKDATSGSGSSSDHINCNATNGDPYTQAENLCEGMKASGVVVYTIGFDIGNSQAAVQLMTNCATDPSRAFLAATGAQLIEAFGVVAMDITQLRISK